MRRQVSVSILLYNYLYPRPSINDPPNFSAFLARFLIPEIRVETARFYGSLDTIEARYPGLNYTHAPHIMRLCTFPHHSRLFRAVKELGLTDGEVMDLVRWEGTLWARERFERDEGIKVKDTTGDTIGPWVDPRALRRTGAIQVDTMTTTSIAVQVEEVPTDASASPSLMDEDESDEDMSDDGEDTMETGSVGVAIDSLGHDFNRRMLAAAAARQQGEQVEMDPEFEAFLKEQVENGVINAAAFSNADNLGQELAAVLNSATGLSVPRPGHSHNTAVTQPAG